MVRGMSNIEFFIIFNIGVLTGTIFTIVVAFNLGIIG